MNITLAGIIFLPLSMSLYIIAPQYLYYFMVFLIPFSATAIFDISSSGSEALLLFGGLWIVSKLFFIVKNGKIRVLNSQKGTMLLLVLFGVICLVSLVMPIIIDGDIVIYSASLNEMYEYHPHTFTSANLKQTFYVLFGIISTLFVANENIGDIQLIKSLKVYVSSGIFVSLWGIMQFVFYYIRVPYPEFIFNSNSTRTYSAIFSGIDTTRIASVAVEPSLLAQFLLSVLPIICATILFKRPLFSLLVDRTALILIVIVLFISTSATAYIGFILMVLSFLVILIKANMMKIKHLSLVIFSLSILMIGTLLAYYFSLDVQLFVDNILLNKQNGYSGLERAYTIEMAFQYFLEYPILGLGFGSVISHDLIVALLANTGVIGFMVFIAIVMKVLNDLIKTLKENVGIKQFGSYRILGIGLGTSFCTIVLTDMITGFHYIFGHLWFILGLNISLISILANKHVKYAKKHSER